MAKLPDAQSIQTSLPQPSGQVASYRGGVAEAGAADMGRGFAQLGRDVRATADEFQNQANEVWARDASTSLMLGMNGASEEYRRKEGMDAVGAYQLHVTALDDMRQKAIATAPNPAAAKLLADQSAYVMGRIVAGAQSYSAQQFKIGQERSHTAAASAITTMAINQQNDPDVIAQSETAIRQGGRAIAEARGLHGEEADAFATMEVGKFYKTLLSDMAARNRAGADALFEQVKGRMDGASQAAISHMLKVNNDQQTGASAAMDAWGGGQATGDFADRIIQRESGNRPDMKDPGSSASGYGGFRNTTWAGFAKANPAAFQGKTPEQIQAMRGDRDLTRQAINWYAQQNAPRLRAVGIEPTNANLAVAHVGVGNAIKIIKADPAAMAASVLSEEVMKANPAWQKMTAGQLRRSLSAGYDVEPGQSASPPGAINNAPDYTQDRTNAFATLYGKYQRGELNETQFSLALTKLTQLQQIDTKMRADASEAAMNEYIPKALTSPGMFDMNAMLSDGRLTGLQKQHIFDVVNRAVRGNMDKPTEVSQAKRTELLDGIRDGSVTSHDRLLQAVAHEGLSTADYSFVRARLDEAQTENGRSLNRQTTELFHAVEKDIGATLVPGLSNPLAGVDFYRFKAFAYAKIAEAQKAGKVAALFDPASPDFLGSRAVVDRFKSDMDTVMRARMSGGGDAKLPTLPTAATEALPVSEQDQLRADVQSGKISRAEGARIAREKGWIRAAPSDATGGRSNMVPVTP